MIGVSGIERVVGFIGQVGQVDPKAIEKLDTMTTIDRYAESMGVDPTIIKSNDEVNKELAAQQQAAMAQQQAAMAQQSVATAKEASQIDTTQGNAVGDLLANAGLQ